MRWCDATTALLVIHLRMQRACVPFFTWPLFRPLPAQPAPSEAMKCPPGVCFSGLSPPQNLSASSESASSSSSSLPRSVSCACWGRLAATGGASAESNVRFSCFRKPIGAPCSRRSGSGVLESFMMTSSWSSPDPGFLSLFTWCLSPVPFADAPSFCRSVTPSNCLSSCSIVMRCS